MADFYLVDWRESGQEVEITTSYTIPSSAPYYIRLTEVPRKYINTIQFAGYNLKEQSTGIPGDRKFVVDYSSGMITFNSNQAGLQISITYDGRGSVIWAVDINMARDVYLEVVEARGEMATLDERLDVAMDEYGSLKGSFMVDVMEDGVEVVANPSNIDFRHGLDVSASGTIATIAIDESELDHGIMSGLADDDHLQYHTDDRGDARYYTQDQVDNLLGATTLGFYFYNDASTDIAGYKTLLDTESGAPIETITETIATDDTLIEEFVTPSGVPGITFLNEGIYTINIHGSAITSGKKDATIYGEIYIRTEPGDVETLVVTTEESSVLTTVNTHYELHGSLANELPILESDRIVVKIYGNINGGGENPDVSIHMEGTTASRVEILGPDFTREHRELHGLTDDDHPQYLLRQPITDQVINDAGGDFDFRIGASGVTNAFFVQGSDGFVGIGQGTPLSGLSIGTGNTSHSLNAINDLFITGNAEVDGNMYFDGSVIFNSPSGSKLYTFTENGSDAVYMRPEYGTDQFIFQIGSRAGRQLILGDSSHYNSDYDHAVQDNPTLYIHSVTDPDSNNTQWISITHDQTDAIFECGKGKIYFNKSGADHDFVVESTSNVNMFYVNAGDNKVGIGRVPVSCEFEVEGDIQAKSGGKFRWEGNSDTTYISAAANYLTISAYSNIELSTSAGTNKDIFIMPDGTGKVGIRTNTPDELLHVNGIIKGEDRIINITDPIDLQDVATKNYVDVVVASGILPSGVVPHNYLTELTDDDHPQYLLRQPITDQVINDAGGDFDFRIAGTGNANTFYVDAGNDRVGISTSSPSSALHIKAGVSGLFGQIIIQNPAHDTTSNVAITAYESDGSGNLEDQLWYLGSSASANENITFLNRRNAELRLGTNNADRLTILGNGNVGINTITPGEVLDVRGNINASGLLDVAGVATFSDSSLGFLRMDANGARGVTYYDASNTGDEVLNYAVTAGSVAITGGFV